MSTIYGKRHIRARGNSDNNNGVITICKVFSGIQHYFYRFEDLEIMQMKYDFFDPLSNNFIFFNLHKTSLSTAILSRSYISTFPNLIPQHQQLAEKFSQKCSFISCLFIKKATCLTWDNTSPNFSIFTICTVLHVLFLTFLHHVIRRTTFVSKYI